MKLFTTYDSVEEDRLAQWHIHFLWLPTKVIEVSKDEIDIDCIRPKILRHSIRWLEVVNRRINPHFKTSEYWVELQ